MIPLSLSTCKHKMFAYKNACIKEALGELELEGGKIMHMGDNGKGMFGFSLSAGILLF